MRAFVLVSLLAAAAAVSFLPAADSRLLLRDVDGHVHGSLSDPEDGKHRLLFFLTTDCPITNQYTPEIRRICADFGPRGVRCFLVYVDPAVSPDALRTHRRDFGLLGLAAILDARHHLTHAAGATVSSETALFSNSGKLEYRGRIDDLYAALGTRRLQPTRRDLREALAALTSDQPVPTPRTSAFGCFIPEIQAEDRLWRIRSTSLR